MKLCLIGCGVHTKQVYLPSLLRLAKERPLVLAGCCDLDPRRAEEMRSAAGFAQSYSDFREMLSKERPDAAIVVTPHTKTAAVAAEVCGHTSHILIEKPPGATLAECESILAAATQAGTRHQVAFNRRHMPLIRRFRELVRQAGQIRSIQYTMCRQNRTEDFFFVTAVHGVDYVRYIAGCDYEDVRFRYQPLATKGVANILMDASFTSGTVAQLSFLVMSGLVHERMMVTCDDVSILCHIPIWDCSDSPGFVSVWRGDRQESYESGAEISGGDASLYYTNGFYHEIKSFLDDAESNRQPTDGLESALQVVAIGEAIARRLPQYRR